MKTSILLSVFFVMTSFFAFGHGGNGHKKKKTEESVTHSHEMGANTTHGHETKLLKADFDDFPTLHPLVVHFPIVLLLLAALAQLGSLLIFKHELSWVTMLLLLFGFTGAWLAGSIVHPHTSGLS
ncbi:MAG TPA: hypothetical protein ENJ82_08225, partial [Bacteroidetes bacterium]|nr:hypothetical protein [Bacteroidota bacterium]